ncbi:hypothetical protein [Spirosoma telluris]|uniref:hypothetical protein n=1 Tax=Spirosoma telluris TaxID=2183553 RepID=UPI002FC38FE0
MIKRGNNSLMSNKRTGWHWLAGSLVCFLTSMAGAQTLQEPIVNRCATVDHEQVLQQRDPNRLRQLTELNNKVQQAWRIKSRYVRLLTIRFTESQLLCMSCIIMHP